MIEAATITQEEEKKLLAQWFETVQFDKEFDGIPELEPEEDDESRSAVRVPQGLSEVDMEDLMAELRKRDPDNPF